MSVGDRSGLSISLVRPGHPHARGIPIRCIRLGRAARRFQIQKDVYTQHCSALGAAKDHLSCHRMRSSLRSALPSDASEHFFNRSRLAGTRLLFRPPVCARRSAKIDGPLGGRDAIRALDSRRPAGPRIPLSPIRDGVGRGHSLRFDAEQHWRARDLLLDAELDPTIPAVPPSGPAPHRWCRRLRSGRHAPRGDDPTSRFGGRRGAMRPGADR